MAFEVQGPQSSQPHRRKRFPWLLWVIVSIVTIAIIAFAIITIFILKNQGAVLGSTTLNIIYVVVGIIAGLLGPLIAYIQAHHHRNAGEPSPLPIVVQVAPSPPPELSSPNEITYLGIRGLPPPIDPRTIQQRESAVKEVYLRLTQSGITALALTGIAGAGKSTLAALVYHYAEEQRITGSGLFTGDSIWLSIDSAVTMADLAGSLFEALGKTLPNFNNFAPYNQAVALFNALNSSDTVRLVMLDQFENLLDWQTGHALVDRPGVGEWLDIINSQQCRCRILLTSRPWPQGTREYPPTYMQEFQVGGLEITEGIELLRKQGVETMQATEADLRLAVERCEGHAYALTLLSSLLRRNRGLSLPFLFTDPTYAHLWTGNVARNLLDRIYTQQLEDVQRKLLLAFSVYREPVPLGAAENLIEFSAEIQKMQLLPSLNALLAQHLLQSSSGGRYQLHAIVVSYAKSHFDRNDEATNEQARQVAHSRAAQYYLQVAKASYPPQEQRQRSSDIHPLIEAIWQFCQARRWQEAYNLMQEEQIFSDLNRWGGNTILLELYQQLMPVDNWCHDRSQIAGIYNNMGEIYRMLGQIERAKIYYEQAQKICQEIGNREEEGWALNHLGRVYNTLGNKKRALEYYEQALSIHREVGNRWAEGLTLNNLGWVYYDLWQKNRALEYYEQALSIHREVGDRRGEGSTLSSLGRLYDNLGQKELALDYLEQALSIRREIGDRSGEGWTLADMGQVYSDLEEKERAQQYYEQALKIHREVGDRRGEGATISYLGKVYADLGQEERAVEYLEWALRIRKEIGDRGGEGQTLNNLGHVYQTLGKEEQALTYYSQAVSIRKEVGDRGGEGTSLYDIGMLFLSQRRYDVALASFLLARAIFEEIESPRRNIAQNSIEEVRKTLGEEEFAALSADIGLQTSQIVKKALNAASL